MEFFTSFLFYLRFYYKREKKDVKMRITVYLLRRQKKKKSGKCVSYVVLTCIYTFLFTNKQTKDVENCIKIKR